MKLGVSIVVCTFNGANLLPETIRHIAQQRVRPDIQWEVIIIDNASIDDTSRIVEAEWGKYNHSLQFRLLYQPEAGLAYARELALKNAQYEFVLFCDDDNWLDLDYVNRAYDLMLQRPSIGVLGGNGELLFETSPPDWLGENSIFANGPQAKESGSVKSRVVYGAGFVIRNTAFKAAVEMGFKSMLTDRVAGKLSAGGDYEICYAIALAGYDIWYDEELKFKHFIPGSRTCWDYNIRLIREGVKSFEVLIPYRIQAMTGSAGSFSFHLAYFWIFMSYLLKLFVALYANFRFTPGPDEFDAYELKVFSLKCKISSLMAYTTIKKNYERILKNQKANSIVDLKFRMCQRQKEQAFQKFLIQREL